MANPLIVFVHGLGGDPTSTWGKFADLIKDDTALSGFESASYGFPTSLFRLPFAKKSVKIQTLADALRTLLNTRYPDRKDFILVCHSLGGLIARRYLIDEVKRKAKLRVRGVLLYGTPNSGAGLALVASRISWRHNQLKQLCRDSDLLQDLNADWDILGVARQVAVRCVVGGLDNVVTEQSARSSWGNQNVDVIADAGHIDLAKPRDATDLRYLVLRKFVRSVLPALPDPVQVVQTYATPSAATRPKSASKKGYRVIAMDLDGTLLRGIEFSWTAVWQYLQFPEPVYKAAMKDYRKGVTSYQQWCDLAVQHFRAKGLRRLDFPKIVAGITVTKNLVQTIMTLRTEGFVVALISGGIDTFLEELIPDASDLFDYLCINRLHFEQPSGLIAGVDATPFDFEGKAVALEAICKLHGCTLKESVFVGEGFNDQYVANTAGLSIAYPPHETSINAVSIPVADDDLAKILRYVL